MICLLVEYERQRMDKMGSGDDRDESQNVKCEVLGVRGGMRV